MHLENLVNSDTQNITNNIELITDGYIYDKLFCDSFFDNWNYKSNNYLFIAYLYLHHRDILRKDTDDLYYIFAMYYLDIYHKNNICELINEKYHIIVYGNHELLYNKIKNEYSVDFLLKTEIYFKNLLNHPLFTKYDNRINIIQNIQEYGEIIIDNIIYPFNSGATMHFFNIGRNYEEKKIELIEKYGTEKVICLYDVINYPDLYKIDNEYKIYYFLSINKISLEIQDYYNIIFELIVKKQFTLINLYRATNGNINFFYKILDYEIDKSRMYNILQELENYPDIIIEIIKKNNIKTGIILDYLIDQEPKHF